MPVHWLQEREEIFWYEENPLAHSKEGFQGRVYVLDQAWEEGIMEDDADDDDEDVWNNVVMDDGIQFDGPTADVSDKDPQVQTNLDQMLHEGPRGLNDERDIKKFK